MPRENNWRSPWEREKEKSLRQNSRCNENKGSRNGRREANDFRLGFHCNVRKRASPTRQPQRDSSDEDSKAEKIKKADLLRKKLSALSVEDKSCFINELLKGKKRDDTVKERLEKDRIAHIPKKSSDVLHSQSKRNVTPPPPSRQEDNGSPDSLKKVQAQIKRKLLKDLVETPIAELKLMAQRPRADDNIFLSHLKMETRKLISDKLRKIAEDQLPIGKDQNGKMFKELENLVDPDIAADVSRLPFETIKTLSDIFDMNLDSDMTPVRSASSPYNPSPQQQNFSDGSCPVAEESESGDQLFSWHRRASAGTPKMTDTQLAALTFLPALPNSVTSPKSESLTGSDSQPTQVINKLSSIDVDMVINKIETSVAQLKRITEKERVKRAMKRNDSQKRRHSTSHIESSGPLPLVEKLKNLNALKCEKKKKMIPMFTQTFPPAKPPLLDKGAQCSLHKTPVRKISTQTHVIPKMSIFTQTHMQDIFLRKPVGCNSTQTNWSGFLRNEFSQTVCDEKISSSQECQTDPYVIFPCKSIQTSIDSNEVGIQSVPQTSTRGEQVNIVNLSADKFSQTTMESNPKDSTENSTQTDSPVTVKENCGLDPPVKTNYSVASLLEEFDKFKDDLKAMSNSSPVRCHILNYLLPVFTTSFDNFYKLFSDASPKSRLKDGTSTLQNPLENSSTEATSKEATSSKKSKISARSHSENVQQKKCLKDSEGNLDLKTYSEDKTAESSREPSASSELGKASKRRPSSLSSDEESVSSKKSRKEMSPSCVDVTEPREVTQSEPKEAPNGKRPGYLEEINPGPKKRRIMVGTELSEIIEESGAVKEEKEEETIACDANQKSQPPEISVDNREEISDKNVIPELISQDEEAFNAEIDVDDEPTEPKSFQRYREAFKLRDCSISLKRVPSCDFESPVSESKPLDLNPVLNFYDDDFNPSQNADRPPTTTLFDYAPETASSYPATPPEILVISEKNTRSVTPASDTKSEQGDHNGRPKLVRGPMQFHGYEGAIHNLKLSGNHLLAACEHIVHCFSLRTGRRKRQYHSNNVQCISVMASHQGEVLFCGTRQTIQSFSVQNSSILKTSPILSSIPTCMDTVGSLTDGSLYVGLQSGDCLVLNPQSLKVFNRISFAEKPIVCISAVTLGIRRGLVVSSLDCRLLFKDLSNIEIKQNLQWNFSAPAEDFLFQDNVLYSICKKSSSLVIFSYKTGQGWGVPKCINLDGHLIGISLSQNYLFTANSSGTFTVFDTESMKAVSKFWKDCKLCHIIVYKKMIISTMDQNRRLCSWPLPKHLRALIS